MLELNPGLEAKTLFEWLCRREPGRFQEGQLRTLQRRIKQWRARSGPPKEVYFSQAHEPGRLGASDFTHMSGLGVTIDGQSFDHLVYHFVPTHSNWEHVTVCFTESFESLAEGFQNAVWTLDGVPERHRSDSLSAAVNNPSSREEFTRRYEGLMDHYGVTPERVGPRRAHENGDAEQSHHRFKRAVDQQLMLRGGRDFSSREEYESFLLDLTRQRNSGRGDRIAEDVGALRDLPARRLESFKTVTARVDKGSLIHVDGNAYSVPSRLIGERVVVRVHAERLEVWHGDRLMERLPRLRGRSKHKVSYRHVIDWLVRKPGAFERYLYRDDLFPTSRFRMAYDELRSRKSERSSAREYLRILELAAKGSESAVDDALRSLIESDEPIAASSAERLALEATVMSSPLEVGIASPALSELDALFESKEQWDGTRTDSSPVARVPGGAVSVERASELRGVGAAGGEGASGLRGVAAGAVRTGVPESPAEPDRTSAARVEDSAGEGPGELRHEASAGEGGPSLQDACWTGRSWTVGRTC